MRRRLVIITASILIVVFAFSAWGFSYYTGLLKPIDPHNTKPVAVTIPTGSSLKDVGRILEEKGLVRKAWAIEFYARWNHLNQYRSGIYTFNRSMSALDLINDLKYGRHKQIIRVVDVRQGMWVEEIAGQMAKAAGESRQAVLKKLSDPLYIRNHYMKKFPFLKQDIFAKGVKYPLEGYLAPGIYKFKKDHVTLDLMVDKMLDKTEKTISRLNPKISSSPLGSIHRILTMASLVEQEAPGAKDRKRIAGVFYNRLKKNMRLQTDPSVAYGQQRRIQAYTHKDLQTDTPYNTYTRAGLTAGPIGSPSIDAIEAVLDPIRSKNLYFYARPNGQIFYSKTYAEHQAIVSKYRHEWASQS
ncbi:endolytic transglycosylase MltG [Sporolactobacillus sp. THM7-4]|nr:endolytic transglycosylase MltG [Sporolactobacillus sp. THM7-4]